MGKTYLIDSNVIIDYSALKLPDDGSDFVENLFNNDFLISVATKIKVLGFKDIPEKLFAMEEFVNTAKTLSLDEPFTYQTIQRRRDYKKIKIMRCHNCSNCSYTQFDYRYQKCIGL